MGVVLSETDDRPRGGKVHNHDDQLDGHFYARCGRVDADSPRIVMPHVFEATPPALRCAICDRDWFPRGQPDWHHRAAVERQQQREKERHEARPVT